MDAARVVTKLRKLTRVRLNMEGSVKLGLRMKMEVWVKVKIPMRRKLNRARSRRRADRAKVNTTGRG